ncbi:multidrug ABC transporter permease [Anaerobacillus isosaccharinicus]|uniref:Multidrug ABC transporter permease n=1 Tax=Anaerobacillus isosaccharinicus TaxID=1532552 RepID=A0A1S2LCS2_9BACI|nr:hypothetical protein [Anaerobacillus isosaccharinicus]MBA5588147.1 multidrug ABC transporter permease [Anaerobacillus isosaccharinicus]QOY38399.1 multidrug ABC transporter permease [Anaerobacillus isosaccharinicus]
MQLKTLLFNRGIMTQNLRSVGWIGIAYFLCLFFSVPLQILMIFSSEENSRMHYLHQAENLFRFTEEFQLILMFTVPVLLAIFLFRYLHVKLSSDYIHSLPIKRVALYHQHLIFGIVMLMIPVLLTGVILLVLSGFVDAPELLKISLIGQWVGSTILINTFVFTASVFVAMFTGISVFQGVLTYILFVFPAGVTVLFFMNIKYLLHGFAVDYYLHNQMERIVPFVTASKLVRESLSGIEIAVFLLLTLISYLIALVAYQKRKVETATQAIAFRSLQPVFLYGVTFCSMLLGGMYFGETQEALGWRIFGYIIASIIGYFVALMILEKSWRVLTKWKGYSIFVTIMVLLALLISFDVTGYENRIPSLDKIERAYFGEGVYMMDEKRFDSDIHDYKYRERYYYQEKENIENIRQLHEQIVKTQGRFDQYSGHYRNAVFGYELANGKMVVRQYRVPQDFYTKPNQFYGAILESEEHKWNVHGVLRLDDVTEIDKITIMSNRGMQQLTITNRDDIESFHRTFQKEFKEETYEQFQSNVGSWASVDYLLKDNQRVYSAWKKSFDQVEAWLEERNLVKQARLTGEDISYAIVIKKDKEYLYDYMRYDDTLKEFENRPDAIRIDNFDQLEECLKLSSWNDSGDFVIAYYLHADYSSPLFESIDFNNAPTFIKEKLE